MYGATDDVGVCAPAMLANATIGAARRMTVRRICVLLLREANELVLEWDAAVQRRRCVTAARDLRRVAADATITEHFEVCGVREPFGGQKGGAISDLEMHVRL